jgi:hypothetical protein
VFAPKAPQWAWGSGAAAAVVLAAYWAVSLRGTWQPGRLPGLIAGTAALSLFVVAALYPLRRRWGARPFGTAQAWLQFHLYGSALGGLLVLTHMDFRLPAGFFGWLLFAGTFATIATGLIGVLLQKTLPLILVRELRTEAIYERIPELVGKLTRDADAVVEGASEMLATVYRSEIRPILESPRPGLSYLFDRRGPRVQATAPLARLGAYIDEADRARVSALEAIVSDKLDLDIHLSLQRALRVWVLWHIPPALLLMGLLAVHVVAVLYF